MSEYTKKLKLFKYDVVKDSKTPFSIERALNYNWDIIDEHITDTDLSNLDMIECAVVVKTEKNGTSECRIWSDGYIEQSGSITRDATGGVQIYFLYPFKNNEYEMNFTQETIETYTTKTGSYYQPYITEKKKESVYVCCQSAIAQIGYIRWSAKGYINTVV